MKIIAIDPFYLKMPEITAAADGTQDTLVVRIRTDNGLEGYGECDASPLVSLAAYVCPMSHGNIINIRESLLGETVASPDDVRRLHAKALRNGRDIAQFDHAYSAADIALWDVLGKHRGQPVYRLLGGTTSHPKKPYASVLFGDTPGETLQVAQKIRAEGYAAAKFGWGAMGKNGPDGDVALVRAAREGLGSGAELMVDAGWAWGRDVETAADRARRFAPYRLTWLEEPLLPDAVSQYGELAARKLPVPIAAGENASTYRAAEDYVEQGKLSFVQIDAGRIGGITVAREVVKLARERRITYVNHTFKSRLSLAAALHAFADMEEFRHLEYPTAGTPLAVGLASGPFDRDARGLVSAPEVPGLGVRVNPDCLRKYGAPVKIEVGGRTIFETGTPQGAVS